MSTNTFGVYKVFYTDVFNINFNLYNILNMEKIKFVKGFEVQGVKYGWKKGKLYRLPYLNGVRFYPLKEVESMSFSNGSLYYLIRRTRFSTGKLLAITQDVDWEIDHQAEHEDLPTI